MSETETFDAEAFVDAMAPLLGFTEIADYRAAVIANLKLALTFAELVMTFPLDDREEPAGVFRA